MCSNLELDGGVELMKHESSNVSKRWCRKCVDKTEANVVLRKKDAYCKQCFLSSVTHKFRACLGKSKLVRPGDKVLIGFSGSNNSVALLHLIKSGLQELSHKKLMFQPSVIFINDEAVLNLIEEESNKIMEDVNNVLKQFDFPVYQVPVTLSIQSEESLQTYLAGGSSTSVGSDATLQELLSALKSVTAKTDMLCKLRYSLLVQTAKCLGCTKVFTAESADDLAVKLLANVSLGRGAQLPYDVGFSDDRISEVKVIRPLRDLSKKELAFYNVFHNLTSVHIPSLSTKADVHSSIQKLTESFLSELQDGFPSTLSTVFRVADKLTTNSSKQNICPLCKTQRDPDEASCSSLSATQFSRLVASLGPNNFDATVLAENNSDTDLCDGNDRQSRNSCCGGASRSSEPCDKEFQDLLCYGCNLILKDADLTTLPPAFIKGLRTSSQIFRMKKEIEEFLL